MEAGLTHGGKWKQRGDMIQWDGGWGKRDLEPSLASSLCSVKWEPKSRVKSKEGQKCGGWGESRSSEIVLLELDSNQGHLTPSVCTIKPGIWGLRGCDILVSPLVITPTSPGVYRIPGEEKVFIFINSRRNNISLISKCLISSLFLPCQDTSQLKWIPGKKKQK